MNNYPIKEIIYLSQQLKQGASPEDAKKLTALSAALAAWQDYSLADLEKAGKPKKVQTVSADQSLPNALAALSDLEINTRERTWQALIQDTKFTADDWKNAAKAICNLSRKPGSKQAALAKLSQQYDVSPLVAFDLGTSVENQAANVQALVIELKKIQEIKKVVDLTKAYEALALDKKFKADDWKKAANLFAKIKAKSGVDAKKQLKNELEYRAAHIAGNWQ
jgi:hypothetical protein